MAITYHNNDEASLAAGGTWFDDFGRVICTWTWDPRSLVLTVICGPQGRTHDLSKAGALRLPENELRSRLVQLALLDAESILGARFDV